MAFSLLILCIKILLLQCELVLVKLLLQIVYLQSVIFHLKRYSGYINLLLLFLQLVLNRLL